MGMNRILIIDDFRTNIRYLTRLLESENYEIHSATNLERTIEIISCDEFDLILLDIIIPGKDGYTICKEIRKSIHNAQTPVIFVTS
jgi:PleD family two-component response regulator